MLLGRWRGGGGGGGVNASFSLPNLPACSDGSSLVPEGVLTELLPSTNPLSGRFLLFLALEVVRQCKKQIMTITDFF